MARNFDQELIDQLKNYIKSQWMQHSQKAFQKTIVDIAKDIYGESTIPAGGKIWRYLKLIEKGGAIKIEQGPGAGSPNWYTFVADNIDEKLLNTNQECINTIEDFSSALEATHQLGINIFADLSKKYLAALGEANYYKQALHGLELFSIGTDGKQLFRSDKEINSIVEQIKKDEAKQLNMQELEISNQLENKKDN